jgi:hypothetical protein
MGWASYQNGAGRDAGYAVSATCDHPECNEAIDRGLAYCCGGLSGVSSSSIDHKWPPCGGYYCGEHMRGFSMMIVDGEEVESICEACYENLPKCPDCNDDLGATMDKDGNITFDTCVLCKETGVLSPDDFEDLEYVRKMREKAAAHNASS